jgi:hypothetical protein
MKPSKKPPPDNRANILGRISHLRSLAHASAAGGVLILIMDEKGRAPKAERRSIPKDYDKRLAAALKELEPEFKKLERRLKKCPSMPEASAKPKAPPAKSPKPVNGRRRKNTAASVLDGGSSQEPLSRESALTQAVAKPKGDILDFMQSNLD